MDRDDMQFEETETKDELEEAARRRRERRRRERRLKRITIILVLLVILAAVALVYAFVLVPRDDDLPWPSFWVKRPSFQTQSQSAGKDDGAAIPDAGENRQKESEVQKETAMVQETRPVTQETAPQSEAAPDEPSKREDAQAQIAEARKLAMGYDYDGAVMELMTISGYDTDSTIQQMIADYTAQRDACTAVDPFTVPHIFYHSLINDTNRAFNVSAVGASMVDGLNAWMCTVDEFDEILGDGYLLCTPERTPDHGMLNAQIKKKGTVYQSFNELSKAPESDRNVWRAQLFAQTDVVLEGGKSYVIKLDVEGSRDQAEYRRL